MSLPADWAADDPTGHGRVAPPTTHRVIRLQGRPGLMRAALEDDFHHLRVAIAHDGTRVTGVETDALRVPYSLCPSAGRRLEDIIGMPMTEDMTAVFRFADARDQCTHQFDLAAVAVAAAARGVARRRYDVAVEVEQPGVRRRARVSRDGVPTLAWTLDGYAVASPAPFAGRNLGRGFTAWVADALSPEEAEAALVLRRGIFISGGRGTAEELDRRDFAPVTGGCWVQQVPRAASALRRKGSTLDFTGRAALLTRDDDVWLANEA